MTLENEYSVFDFVVAISEAVDLVFPFLHNHHKRVAYISCKIAEEMHIPDNDIKDIAMAAIIHDIGAFSIKERKILLNHQAYKHETANHAIIGCNLLENFELLKNVSKLIRWHHNAYDEASDIPIGSYIIHLADRLAVMCDESSDILEQVPSIMEKITRMRGMFAPDAVEALQVLSGLEYFWIELELLPPHKLFPERIKNAKEIVDLPILRDFAKVFSQIIDFRSQFTATHSSGIAAVARELSVIAGFSHKECVLMEIAGHLHDLGKLAIANEILEKNGKLDRSEFNIMRKHTYCTYSILHNIKGMEQVAEWAAFHHERLDGRGYPFHIKADALSKLARIMAVADIFTAITEDRPYRAGMTESEAMTVMNGMVESGGIDGAVVKLVQENFEYINNARMVAQKEALSDYEKFNRSNCETDVIDYPIIKTHHEQGEAFGGNEATVWQCSDCGHIYKGEEMPEICPVCGHANSYYMVRATV